MKKIFTILIILSLTTIISAQNFYMGIENPSGGCTGCHSNLISAWSETGHANAWEDGAESAFFGYSCIGCHTVGFDETVLNGGADEYVTAGENNSYTITDEANFNLRKNVQCESCHGPKGNATGSSADFSHISDNTVNSLSADVCAGCHTGSHHPTFDDWSTSKHAFAKFTTIPGAFEFIASDANCAGCHTAEGFLQFIESDELEPNVVAPGAEGNDITCTACHDPHSEENDAQLRLPAAEICAKCHNPEYNPDSPTPDGSTLHHTTAYMFDGKGGYEYDGVTYSNSTHTFAITEKCVSCHVFETPYVGGDPEIPAFTGHSFEPHLESCVQCHADFDPAGQSFDYRGTQTEITGLMEQLEAKLSAAAPEDSTTDAFLRAKYNYDFVNADGSHGIHNTKYAKGLLESSLANFTPTSVETPDNMLPEVYSLGQNYPNPFNPSTTISFSLPEASDVQLTVYDAIGNEIITLVSQRMSAGVHNIEWNASNHASGMYIYKITANDFVQTLKMVMIK